MPPNTVYVGRPTQWGNPFTVGEFPPFETGIDNPLTREGAIRLYEEWLRKQLATGRDLLGPLKGKNLACWCKLDQPYHADILLQFLGET